MLVQHFATHSDHFQKSAFPVLKLWHLLEARFMYILDIHCKCIFWTFTASIYLHKNEAWIRAYIFCNITFVKSNTSNTLLKIAVPWVNTESLNVTKPIWLQFYIYGKITPPIYHSIKSSHVQWPMSQVATCDRGGVTDTWMWHFVCTFLSKYDEVSRIIIKYQMGKTDKN